MDRKRVWTAIVVGSSVLLLLCHQAGAEWFADLYTGASFSERRDVKISDRGIGPATFANVEFDAALARGLRFGRYFDSLPFLALGADYFEFNPNIGPQSVRVRGCVAIGSCSGGTVGLGSFDLTTRMYSVEALFRLPLLKTDAAPSGRIQPYVAGGLPIVLTTVDPRNTRLFRNHNSDTGLSVGYTAAGGVAVQVYETFFLFAEYRYLHSDIDVDLQDSATASRTSFSTDLDTHSALFGISARW